MKKSAPLSLSRRLVAVRYNEILDTAAEQLQFLVIAAGRASGAIARKLHASHVQH